MRFAKGLYIYVSLKCIAIHSVAKYDLSHGNILSVIFVFPVAWLYNSLFMFLDEFCIKKPNVNKKYSKKTIQQLCLLLLLF